MLPTTQAEQILQGGMFRSTKVKTEDEAAHSRQQQQSVRPKRKGQFARYQSQDLAKGSQLLAHP